MGALNRRAEGALSAMAMQTSSAVASQRGGRMLLQGTTGLGMGVLQGVTGLALEPYRGARKAGARGFAVGVGKGLVGAAIRPTAGIAKFAHRLAGAAQQAAGDGVAHATHSARLGRVRPPRMLHGAERRIAAYSIAEAMARHVLTSAGEGKCAPCCRRVPAVCPSCARRVPAVCPPCGRRVAAVCPPCTRRVPAV